MGILYYGRYLALFELGRVEFMREQGFVYREMEDQLGLMLPVTAAHCRYKTPLEYDDLALIRTWVSAWGPATLRFAHEIHSQNTGLLCATGEVELGCLSRQSRRPARLPAGFVEMLKRTAPDSKGRKRGNPLAEAPK